MSYAASHSTQEDPLASPYASAPACASSAGGLEHQTLSNAGEEHGCP
jgi:hypothetical protein